jgi:hypothetical protein
MLKSKALAGLLALSLIGPGVALASADAVEHWNEITLAVVSPQRPGPQSMLDVALVHVAIHDAVQSIERRYEPYNVEIPNARGSRVAAVAAAAHGVLVGISQDPAQIANVDAAYATFLANHGLHGDPGLDVGKQVAARMLPLRRKTPEGVPPFVGEAKIGKWRPTPSELPGPPDSNLPMMTPWLGNTDPFTLTGPARFRGAPPPALTSERYRRDYDEVKKLGAWNSRVRTPAQTDLAHFYNDNFFMQWNRVLRDVSSRYLHNTGDSARMFALATMATADALITCWDSKTHYNYWRPITAIREGDADGNPRTVGEPKWHPLINTPNYPDYTSGANNVVGAMTRTLELFFGTDRKAFQVTSNAPNVMQKSRVYRRFSEAAQDVEDARIYLGIHFRFADTEARKQGTQVAEWAFKHFLLPKGHKGHRDMPHVQTDIVD